MSLDLQKRSTAKQIYSDFLENFASYEAAREVWADLADRVAASFPEGEEWTDYGRRVSPSVSKADWDLYPIIQRSCKKLERWFTVEQHEPTNDKFKFAAWVSEFEDWMEIPRYGLFMSVTLSPESLEIAERLLLQWMDPSAGLASLEQTFASLELEFQPK